MEIYDKLRPSEKVLRLLESNLFSSDPSAQEVRLPPMRELAKRLDVSLSTVSAVYRELTASGRIRTQVGNGSFLIRPSAPEKQTRELRIATNLRSASLTEVESWYYRIAGGIMMAALEYGEAVTLQPLAESMGLKDLESHLMGCNALLVMPGGFHRQELIGIGQRNHLPTVFLNPPSDSATENFVSADYFGASKQLGTALLQGGRRNILLVMNEPLHQSPSSQRRMIGLLAGLEFGKNFNAKERLGFEVLFTDNDTSRDAGRSALRKYLKHGGRLPDAIYATGDDLALGCLEVLDHLGKKCPEEVSVVGGAGLSLEGTSYPQLTRCRPPFENIGRELIKMLHGMLADSDLSLPGRILPMSWTGGATTTREENEFLFSSSH